MKTKIILLALLCSSFMLEKRDTKRVYGVSFNQHHAYFHMYLELNEDNTFLFTHDQNWYSDKTEGIYIDKKDSLFLYTLGFGYNFFSKIIDDSLAIERWKTSPDLIFEGRRVLLKAGIAYIDGYEDSPLPPIQQKTKD